MLRNRFEERAAATAQAAVRKEIFRANPLAPRCRSRAPAGDVIQVISFSLRPDVEPSPDRPHNVQHVALCNFGRQACDSAGLARI